MGFSDGSQNTLRTVLCSLLMQKQVSHSCVSFKVRSKELFQTATCSKLPSKMAEITHKVQFKASFPSGVGVGGGLSEGVGFC